MLNRICLLFLGGGMLLLGCIGMLTNLLSALGVFLAGGFLYGLMFFFISVFAAFVAWGGWQLIQEGEFFKK